MEGPGDEVIVPLGDRKLPSTAPQGTEQTLAPRVPTGTPSRSQAQHLWPPAGLSLGTSAGPVLPPPPEAAPAPGLGEGLSAVALREGGSSLGWKRDPSESGAHAPLLTVVLPRFHPRAERCGRRWGEKAPPSRTGDTNHPASLALEREGTLKTRRVPLCLHPSPTLTRIALSPPSLVRVSQPGQSAHPPISVGRGGHPNAKGEENNREGQALRQPRPWPRHSAQHR